MDLKFIAYFDLLGYDHFIQKNEGINDIRVKEMMGNVFSVIEKALAGNKDEAPKNGKYKADLSDLKVHCQIISDSVILWTESDKSDDLAEILEVAKLLHRRLNLDIFPARGAIVRGKLDVIRGAIVSQNTQRATYTSSCLYGSGLIDAYRNAENQNWAGTMICQSVYTEIGSEDGQIVEIMEFEDLVKKYAVKYNVPVKDISGGTKLAYAMTFHDVPLNNYSHLENVEKYIRQNFYRDGKMDDNNASKSVEDKISRTISFLRETTKFELTQSEV